MIDKLENRTLPGGNPPIQSIRNYVTIAATVATWTDAPFLSKPETPSTSRFDTLGAANFDLRGDQSYLIVRVSGEEATYISEPMDLPEWWDDVLDLYRSGRDDDAIYHMFRRIDALLSSGQFVECDNILRSVNVSAMPIDIMIGVLSITLAAHERLPSRQNFFRRVQRKLQADNVDGIDRLLAGLDAGSKGNAENLPRVERFY